MSAILFGSISTLADTSELQRRAFNEAFAAYGLDWNWSRDDYASMLGSNGGAQRIADYAASRGEDVDAAAVHAKKSEIFQELLGTSTVSPRPGVVDVGRRGQAQRPQAGLRHHHLAGQHRRAPGGAAAAHQRRDVRPHRQRRFRDAARSRTRTSTSSPSSSSARTPATRWRSRTTSAGSRRRPPRASSASRSRTRTPRAATSAPPTRRSIPSTQARILGLATS